MAKKTYTDVMRQIDELKAEAEALRKEEVDGVVARIREAIDAYGLTPEDLFGGIRKAKVARKTAGRKPAKARPAAAQSGAKYSDKQGNTWGGRGPRPQWLRDALAGGASLEDFLANA